MAFASPPVRQPAEPPVMRGRVLTERVWLAAALGLCMEPDAAKNKRAAPAARGTE